MDYRIIIADDHQIFREGLVAMLEKQGEFNVIGQAENGREIIALAKEMNPDVVIMDISMPDLNGIEATKQIQKEMKEIKVIALSMHNDKRFITRALGAGAQGYLLKECAFDELSDAIHTIMSDQIYLSKTITSIVIKDYLEKLDVDPNVKTLRVLSVRETEVLQLIAEGKSSKGIASDMFLSVKTIETYRKHIMDKLDIHTVAELTKYAISEGLTSL